MKILDQSTALSELCKATKKWGMFISFCIYPECSYSYSELEKAAPYLKDQTQFFADESGYILFDSEEEMWRAYDQTVGDDGPTESNKYSGPAKVYAITCDPDGQFGTENT